MGDIFRTYESVPKVRSIVHVHVRRIAHTRPWRRLELKVELLLRRVWEKRLGEVYFTRPNWTESTYFSPQSSALPASLPGGGGYIEIALR